MSAVAMRMHDGTEMTVDVPRNTLDPRYVACREHRPGCDCYEAERNEETNEYRAMWEAARNAARDFTFGHPTYPGELYEYVQTPDGWAYLPSADCCQCTGCRIIRKAHL